MPRRALRPCAQPGCPALVTSGRCAAHTVKRADTYRPKPRDQQRFYGSAEWKALRTRVIREEPVCRICHARPSEVVDHIDGDYRNRARQNLRGLCRTCEASRTGRQHAAKRRGVS